MKLIIGLDVSKTCTGVAGILVDKDFNVVRYWADGVKTPKTKTCFGTKRTIDHAKRIVNRVLNDYAMVLKTYDNVELLVAVEDYAYGSAYSREVMAEQTGLVKALLYAKKIPTLVLPVTVIKKAVSGKGNTKKEFIPTHLTKLGYEYVMTSLDVTDALAVAHTGVTYLKFKGNKKLLAYEKESFTKFKPGDQPLERAWTA